VLAWKKLVKEGIMEIQTDDSEKMLTIWLTKAESNDPSVMQRLQPLFKEYKAKKYVVAVFRSGKGDLYENTLRLLKSNLVLPVK
jgi:hypothetical protein